MASASFDGFAQDFANQIAERGVWIQDHLLPLSCIQELLLFAQDFQKQGRFKKASVGKLEKKQIAPHIRRDQILWINDWTPTPLLRVHEVLQQIQNSARRELFLPIQRFESHFSRYQKGDYYKPHVDRHRKRPGRVLSLVVYLNDLEENGGGELMIRTHQDSDLSFKIQPRAGRWVIFDSRLRHEVKTAHHDRWSLTCWFRDDAVLGIEGL